MTDKDKALELLSKLQTFRADNYHDWVKVGMALHSAGCSWQDWDSWSRTSGKYQAGVCEKKWKTFNNYSGTPITIASLAQFAKDDGYIPNRKFEPKKLVEKTPSNELTAYLKALFNAGETVNFVTETFERNGKYSPVGKGICKNVDELIQALGGTEKISPVIGTYNKLAGAWIRLNPVSGDGTKDSDVADCRHCLIEADTLPKHEQLQKLKDLKIPCVAIVDSGGKSIHAIVKIDAGKDVNLFRERVAELHRFLELRGFPADKACKNPSRLSRMPGAVRNGIEQKLIEINPNALSWTKWLESREDLKLDLLTIDQIIEADPRDMSDSLIGKRFLCRDGSWLIIAQSGIGKSVFAMQAAMHFATGRPIFDLTPHVPRRVILIQAENNRLDLIEPSKSIYNSLNTSTAELELLRQNLFIISENKSCGEAFLKLFEKICSRYAPDIVIIDPLLSYIGDDISLQHVCSNFLRNRLNPIIHKYNFGLIFMHHTGKPPKDKPVRSVADLSYLGIGSSELTNWARAVSVFIENKDDNNVFELTHAKRGKRSGVLGRTFLAHATEGNIFWETTTQPEPTENERRFKYDFLELQFMPPLSNTERDGKSELLSYISKKLKDADQHFSFDHARKVYDAARRPEADIIVFDKKTKLWRGSKYGTKGGAE